MISVLGKATDLQLRKAIQISPHSGSLALHLWIHGGRILGLVDNIGNRCKYKSRRIPKGFVFKLSNAIHPNVSRSQCSSNKPPARRLLWFSIGSPTSLTITPSIPPCSLRKQACPVACCTAVSSRCRFNHS